MTDVRTSIVHLPSGVARDAPEPVKIDGRTSAWRFRKQVARDIVECAKSRSRAYELLKTNSKTGGRLVECKFVRQNVARNAANVFLDFLFDVTDGKEVDMSGLNPRIVKQIAARYAVEGASWTDFAEDIESDDSGGESENRPAA
ncbi:MAG: hypothetical protein V4574_19935 [Pseudomonadota bacterium]